MMNKKILIYQNIFSDMKLPKTNHLIIFKYPQIFRALNVNVEKNT